MKYEKNVCTIPFYFEGDTAKYILVKRAEGFWGFPTCRAEVFETENGAAVRAAQEETGLRVSLFGDSWGLYDTYEQTLSDGVIQRFTYVCADSGGQTAFVNDSERISGVAAVTIEEAREYICAGNPLRPQALEVLEKMNGRLTRLRAEGCLYLGSESRNKAEAAGEADSKKHPDKPSPGSDMAQPKCAFQQRLDTDPEFRKRFEHMMFDCDNGDCD